MSSKGRFASPRGPKKRVVKEINFNTQNRIQDYFKSPEVKPKDHQSKAKSSKNSAAVIVIDSEDSQDDGKSHSKPWPAKTVKKVVCHSPLKRAALEERKNVNVNTVKANIFQSGCADVEVKNCDGKQGKPEQRSKEVRKLQDTASPSKILRKNWSNKDGMSLCFSESPQKASLKRAADKTSSVSHPSKSQKLIWDSSELATSTPCTPPEEGMKSEFPNLVQPPVAGSSSGNFRVVQELKKSATLVGGKVDNATATCSVTRSSDKAVSNSKSSGRIVRRSNLNIQEKDSISVTSKIEADMDAINAAALIAFQSTRGSLENLLRVDQTSRVCPDGVWAASNSRSTLGNRYHTNFNFFLTLGDQLGALGALRRIGRHHFPHAEDLHVIIHKIILTTAEQQVVLYRAQELIYNVVSLHPPCSQEMRSYYWSVLSPRFADTDPWCRWEAIRSLLQEVISCSEKIDTGLNGIPSQLERKRAVLGSVIMLLEEDFRCWVQLAANSGSRFALSRESTNIPMVARLLWPQSLTAHVNGPCRELVALHNLALEANDTVVLCYTRALMKMMASIVQLYEMPLPLKMRIPGESMYNLARDIASQANLSFAKSDVFLFSFTSPELRLLLSLAFLDRLKPPGGPILLTGRLSLEAILSNFFEVDFEKSDYNELVSRFQSKPEEMRQCLLSAISAYFQLFGVRKTWFILRDRYRNPPRLPSRELPQPFNIYSRSYTQDQLLDDLRCVKRLCDTRKIKTKEKKRCLYSAFSCI